MNRPMRAAIRVALWAVAVVLLSSCVAGHRSRKPGGYLTFTDSRPVPELLPTDVVEIQLKSLQENRDDDFGIDVAYRFASPKNRAVVGSRDSFATMLRTDRYGPMLNSRSFDVSQIEESRNIAYVAVQIEDDNSDIYMYLFILSRQTGGDYHRCWMTEGVFQIQMPSDSPSSVPAPPPSTSL